MSGNSWVGKHKAELLAVAAVTAAAFTGGASMGLLGAAGGAAAEGAAAGAGAAEAGAAAGFGADAAVGAGMGGSAASAFGPTSAQAALVNGFGSQATPMFTASAGMDAAATGMPQLTMAAGGANPGLLSYMQGGLTNLVGGPDNMDRIGKGFDAFGRAGKVAQASGLLNQQPHAQASPSLPRGNQQVSSPMADSFMQMYGKPVMDPETLRRLWMQQQGGMYGN